MNPLLERFVELSEKGEVRDFEPIPNNVFTFEELEFLFNHGYIYESDNRFIAATSNVLD